MRSCKNGRNGEPLLQPPRWPYSPMPEVPGKQGPLVTCQLAEALAQPPEGQQGGGWGPTAGEERALPRPSSPSPQWREHSREFKAL